MATSSLFESWSSLADSLHMLFLRLAILDTRRPRVIAVAIGAGDKALQSMECPSNALFCDRLNRLAATVAGLDPQNPGRFSTVLADVEAVVSAPDACGEPPVADA